jgi:hypothetical protein
MSVFHGGVTSLREFADLISTLTRIQVKISLYFLTTRLATALVCVLAACSQISLKAAWEGRIGPPLVSEIESMQGGLEEFTWDIVWDKEGIAYLARERIWRWDGTVLEPVGPDIFSEMHAIALDRNGRLLVGGINEFGIYDPVSGEYVSLVDRLPASHRQFGRAWAIHDDGEAVWMGSSNRLFRIAPDSTRVHRFEGKHRVVFHFLASGVYAHEPEVGLWKVGVEEKEIINSNQMLFRRSYLIS